MKEEREGRKWNEMKMRRFSLTMRQRERKREGEREIMKDVETETGENIVLCINYHR